MAEWEQRVNDGANGNSQWAGLVETKLCQWSKGKNPEERGIFGSSEMIDVLNVPGEIQSVDEPVVFHARKMTESLRNLCRTSQWSKTSQHTKKRHMQYFE